MLRSRLWSSSKQPEFDGNIEASSETVSRMNHVQPKKKGRKKANETSKDVAPDLSSDEHVGQFVKIKKSKKTKKRVEIGAGEGERRIVRGTRRIVRQDAFDETDDSSLMNTMIPKSKFTLPSPNLSLINKNVTTSARKVSGSNKLIASSPLSSMKNTIVVAHAEDSKISSSKSNVAVELKTHLGLSAPEEYPGRVNSTYEIISSSEGEASQTRKSPGSPSKKERKRNTYEIEPRKSFLLKETQNKENTPLNSIAHAGPVQAKKLFSVNLQNEKVKMKISESKSSLTDSGMSSASKLFRRAQKMSSTPAVGNSSMGTPMFSSTSITKKSTPLRSNSKVKKVPNYAAIHQKAYDKMENIVAYEQRRKDRGQALLSGNKVLIGMKPQLQTAKPTTTKKHLNFGSPGRTPSSKLASGSIKKAVDFVASSSPIKVATVKLPKTPKPTKGEVWAAYGTKIPKPTGALFTLGSNAKKAVAASKVPFNENKIQRLREVESVSTKSKASSQALADKRREHVQGVRSNRRFDLLMNMRYGNTN